MNLYALLTIVVCTLVVVTGTYFSIKEVVRSFAEKRLWEHRLANHQLITPLRLQAYERMCLFLERITPNNLILRVAGSSTTSIEFHQLLLREIREEFNHNVAQQIYVGSDSWELIRNAKEEIVTIINLSAQEVTQEASTHELARQIMKRVINQEQLAVTVALQALKKEIQVLF